MMIIEIIPIFLQAIIMIIDEVFFHRKRLLPRWERIGHPVDTIFFLIPIFVLINNSSLEVYIVFSVLSCLIITKDEFIHIELCEGLEQWLHSMLFVLHPIIFVSLYRLKNQAGDYPIYLVLIPTIAFLIYQIIYWRPWWNQEKLLTMRSTNN